MESNEMKARVKHLTLDLIDELLNVFENYEQEEQTMKYELLHDDVMYHHGCKLTRIRALRSIKQHNVQVGDLGGYIQNEACLSQEDNEWVPFGFMSFFLLPPIVKQIEE